MSTQQTLASTASSVPKNAHMDIWDRVKATDPQYTKQVSVRGGFTAIDPQYQLEQATKLWGPYGTAWGMADLNYSMVESDGGTSLVLSAKLYYPAENGGGQVEIYVDMKFKPNDDCYKKLLTSARSKALSLLGFGADVFLGKYDDVAYVNAAKVRFGDQDQFRKMALGKIKLAKGLGELKELRTKVDYMVADETIDAATGSELIDLIDEQMVADETIDAATGSELIDLIDEQSEVFDHAEGRV